MAARFALPETYPEAPAAHLEPKSYFLKDVFTDVVFPDRYVARRTKRASGAAWRALTSAISWAATSWRSCGRLSGSVRGSPSCPARRRNAVC